MSLTEDFLKGRGLTVEGYAEMEHFDPEEQLLDMDKMTAALDVVRKNGEQIVIYPDFDMDGVMSGVILRAGLAELGFDVNLYVPDSTKGYGMRVSDVDGLRLQFPDATTIITCDVGIQANEAIEYAVSVGLKVLVTDHHLPGEVEPSATVIVNPNRNADPYSNKGICGAMVAYKTLMAYAKGYQPMKVANIDQLKVFAGVGTVSDSMPLVGENRAVLRESSNISKRLLPYDEYGGVFLDGETVPDGLKYMQASSAEYRNAFVGLAQLYVALATKEKPTIKTNADFDGDLYGFYVAPMFNALKRLEGDMSNAFNVFFEAPNVQRRYIDVLLETNETRKKLVEASMEKIHEEYQPYEPYIYLTDAPAGVRGLLATQLQRESLRPVIVVAGDDMEGYHGSGRSLDGVGLVSGMREFNELGHNGFAAGHEAACGVGFTSGKEMRAFCEFIDAKFKAIPEATEDEPADFELSGMDLNYDKWTDLRQLFDKFTPYGNGWHQPVVELTAPKRDLQIRAVGEDGTHARIQFKLDGRMVVLCWSAFEDLDALGDDDVITFRGQIKRNYFNKTWSVNVIADDYRVA